MIEDDLCRSCMLGLSIRDLRDTGLCAFCSGSEEVDVIESELDIAGDMLGRMKCSSPEMSMGPASGYAAVAWVATADKLMLYERILRLLQCS